MADVDISANRLYQPDEAARTQGEHELRQAGLAALDTLTAILGRRYNWPKPRRVTGFLGIGPNLGELEAEARSRAAALLGALPDPRAADALVAAAHDGDDYVREAVALALGQRGDARAVGPLIDVLSSSHADRRAAAAETLGVLRDPRAFEPLVRMMQTDGQPFPRWAAVRALGQLRDPRAVKPLTDLLLAMIRLPASDWAPTARQRYSEEEPLQMVWTTCKLALEALELIRDPQALPVVEKLAQEAPAHTIANRAARCAELLRQS